MEYFNYGFFSHQIWDMFCSFFFSKRFLFDHENNLVTDYLVAEVKLVKADLYFADIISHEISNPITWAGGIFSHGKMELQHRFTTSYISYKQQTAGWEFKIGVSVSHGELNVGQSLSGKWSWQKNGSLYHVCHLDIAQCNKQNLSSHTSRAQLLPSSEKTIPALECNISS